MRYYLAGLLLVVLFWGCSPGQGKKETPKNQGVPRIHFLSQKHDFGPLKQNEQVTHTYYFTNTGSAELLITNASATCGCTVPEYTRKPVAPGDTGKVKIVFDTGRFTGNQFKSIRIYTNSKANKMEQLTFSAFIQPPEMKKANN